MCSSETPSFAPDRPLDMTLCKMCKNNRASGLFAVVTKCFGRSVTQEMKLCAQCGLYKIAKRVRVFYPKDSPHPVAYHDVISVNLVRTI